jgi:uncharacterized protein
VTMILTPSGSGGTHADIDAEVQLAGKAAAMGRGLIEDVSGKLVEQFAGNLQQMLSNGGTPESRKQKAESSQETQTQTQSSAAPPEGPEPEGVDALGIAASMASDRMRNPKVLFSTLGIVLLIGYLLGRRS